MSENREHDERTGRPRVGTFEAIASLSDRELEQELLTAAIAPDHRRFNRFARLLRERDRRSRRDELVLVLTSGPPDVRAAFTGELARLLGAAYLQEATVWDALPHGASEPTATTAAVLAALTDLHLRARIPVVVDGKLGPELELALGPVQRNHPDVPVVQVEARDGTRDSIARTADEVWHRVRRDSNS